MIKGKGGGSPSSDGRALVFSDTKSLVSALRFEYCGIRELCDGDEGSPVAELSDLFSTSVTCSVAAAASHSFGTPKYEEHLELGTRAQRTTLQKRTRLHLAPNRAEHCTIDSYSMSGMFKKSKGASRG